MNTKDRDAYNAYMRVYLRDRHYSRKAWAIALLGGSCVLCGSLEGLQFDHKDPSTKSFTIARRWLSSLDTLKIELKKCQLLCRSCHQAKTIKDCGKAPAKGTHGTISSYRYCRCSLCKKAKSVHSAAAYVKRKGLLTDARKGT